MKKKSITTQRRCPKCRRMENQINKGYNRSGTRRYKLCWGSA